MSEQRVREASTCNGGLMCARFVEAVQEHEPIIRAFVAYRSPTAPSPDRKVSDVLSGLPFAAKDNFESVDFPTRYGSPIYEGEYACEDAEFIKLARKAGGLLVGKTACAELSMMCPPSTRNPRDHMRTPGGSSSGSAAAVAAGMVAFALGSQTAGSIIRPAAYCGVAGLKPTYGLISTVGMKPLAPSFDTAGLFARDVAGLSFVAQTLLKLDAEPTRVSAPRFGICAHWSDAAPDVEALASIEIVEGLLGANGYITKRLQLTEKVAEAQSAHRVIMAYEAARSLEAEFLNHRKQLSHRLSRYLSDAWKICDDDYEVAQRVAARARAEAATLYDQVDVVLTPSAAGYAPIGRDHTGSSSYNRLWTLLGGPVVNVPVPTGRGNPPLGLQVAGRPGSDALTLATSEVLESALQVAAANSREHLERAQT